MSERHPARVIVPGSETRGHRAGGLVLPGHVATAGRMPTLFVPHGHETQEVVLVGTCSTCDQTFYKGQEDEWQRHVGWCARRNLDEVLAAREEQKQRMAIFQEESWDPEWAAHQREVGKRMLREGRLVPKPNER